MLHQGRKCNQGRERMNKVYIADEVGKGDKVEEAIKVEKIIVGVKRHKGNAMCIIQGKE